MIPRLPSNRLRASYRALAQNAAERVYAWDNRGKEATKRKEANRKAKRGK